MQTEYEYILTEQLHPSLYKIFVAIMRLQQTTQYMATSCLLILFYTIYYYSSYFYIFNCQIKLFLLKIPEAKAIKILVLCGLPVEKFNILLECLLYYIIPKRYGQWDLQANNKTNELLPVMTRCRNAFHNGAMALISNLMTAIYLLRFQYSNFLSYIKHTYWESSDWNFSDWNGFNVQ